MRVVCAGGLDGYQQRRGQWNSRRLEHGQSDRPAPRQHVTTITKTTCCHSPRVASATPRELRYKFLGKSFAACWQETCDQAIPDHDDCIKLLQDLADVFTLPIPHRKATGAFLSTSDSEVVGFEDLGAIESYGCFPTRQPF